MTNRRSRRNTKVSSVVTTSGSTSIFLLLLEEGEQLVPESLVATPGASIYE